VPNNSGVKTSLKVRGFIDLMKLRVVELLLVSTLPAMVLAEQGLPTLTLTLATLIGGTLAAGSANAFNMVI
jgi:protoheme IX farnesyltransferase